MAEPVKSQFEREMDEKIARAREAVTTKYAPLETGEPKAPTSPEVATPEAELPTPEAAASAPEPAQPEPPPAPAPTPEPPKQAVAAPAPTPEPAPIAAAPEPPKVEAKTPENFDWREFRRQQRELRKLEKEMEELRKKTAGAAPAQPVQPGEQPQPVAAAEDDPFGVNKALKEVETLRADQERDRREFAEQQRRNEVDRLRVQIDQQEAVFLQKQPDYYDAIYHTVEFETKRFNVSGLAAARANQMLKAPEYQPVIEKIADDWVAIPDATGPKVPFAARFMGRDGQLMRLVERNQATKGAREISDSEAAQALATDMWITERRNEVIAGATASGRQIPEVVWELAGTMGYQSKAAAAPSNGTPAPAPAAPVRSVAETIRANAKVTAAGKSISQASGGMPADGGAKQFKTLAELMAFRKSDPAGYLAYQKEMSKINPNWHRDLIA